MHKVMGKYLCKFMRGFRLTKYQKYGIMVNSGEAGRPPGDDFLTKILVITKRVDISAYPQLTIILNL